MEVKGVKDRGRGDSWTMFSLHGQAHVTERTKDWKHTPRPLYSSSSLSALPKEK